MHLVDSKQNPIPSHVVQHLKHYRPDASQKELQDYITLLDTSLGVDETAVSYLENEIRSLGVPARQYYAYMATKPHHVSPEEIKTCPLGPYTLFYHPTHSLAEFDPDSPSRHQFFWTFYLGRTKDQQSIIDCTQWKAHKIRVMVYESEKWQNLEQGLVVADSHVRIFENSNKNAVAETVFPPDPTLPVTGVVLLPHYDLPTQEG